MYLRFRHKYQKMQPMSRYHLLGKFCCSFESNLESFCIIMECVPITRNTIVIASECKHPSVGLEGQKTRRTVVPASLKPVRLSSLILERKQPLFDWGLQLIGWGLLTLGRAVGSIQSTNLNGDLIKTQKSQKSIGPTTWTLTQPSEHEINYLRIL